MQIYQSGSSYSVLVKSINQSTKYWTFQPHFFPSKTPYNLETETNPVNKITRVIFVKISNDLPSGLEQQKIYFCREFRNISNVVTGYRLFESHADAMANINALAPTWSQLFYMVYIDKTYGTIDCNEYGAESTSNILCCDNYPEIFTDIRDQATITINGKDVLLKRADISGGQPEYPFLGTDEELRELLLLYSQGRGGNSSHDRYEEYFDAAGYFPNFKTVFHFRFAWGDGVTTPHNLDINVYEWRNPSYYILSGWVQYTADEISTATTFNLQKVEINYQYQTGGFYFLSRNNFADFPQEKIKIPDTIECTISGTTNFAPPVRLYIPDAQFYDATRPVNIGHIDEVLNYDQTLGMYISELKNYYNIPGRIHIRYSPYPQAGGAKYLNGSLDDGSQAINYFRQTYDGYYFNRPFGVHIGNDIHGGYKTGLPQGTPFIDSRIFFNANYAGKIYPATFSVAYSQWNDSRFPRSVNMANLFQNSFYTSNFYAITSKDPACFLSSLEV